MIIDIGTGDGRAVLARAAADSRALVIGIDANAAGLSEASRRASRGRMRLDNALFLAEAVEALPGPLASTGDLVTVTMPWGSLLRGVVGLDERALGGIASVVAQSGRIEVMASITPSDGVSGMTCLDEAAEARVRATWRTVGFDLQSMRPASHEDLASTRSAWARRLGDRPVWRLELARRSAGQNGGH